MGWEHVGKAPRPRDAMTLGIYRSGKHAHTAVLSIPSNLVQSKWPVDKLFTVMRGTGDDLGKLAVMPDAEGRYKLQAHAFQHLIRFPAKGLAQHAAELVSFRWDGETLIVALPEWAMIDAPRPEKGEEPQAQPKKTAEPPKPAPTPKPAPEAIQPQDKAVPQSAPAPTETKRLDPDKARLPAPHPAIATLKDKDCSPEGPTREGNQIRNGKQPVNWEKAADRQTELARRGPQSKPSATEPPPSWRGKRAEEPSIARTDKADISLAQAYLMIGSTPTRVPPHLRGGLARLINRFGEAMPIAHVGGQSHLDELRKLVRPRFTVITSAGDCLLTEA